MWAAALRASFSQGLSAEGFPEFLARQGFPGEADKAWLRGSPERTGARAGEDKGRGEVRAFVTACSR